MGRCEIPAISTQVGVCPGQSGRVGSIDTRRLPSVALGPCKHRVVAEFLEQDHPARAVARAPMFGLRPRLGAIANRFDVVHPDVLAAQLVWSVNGAFVSSERLATDAAMQILLASAQTQVAGVREAELA